MDRKKQQTTAAATPEPGDKQVAALLAQGLTLVPYYARNERGERCAYCVWTRLKHGESIAQAAQRLSVACGLPDTNS